MSPRARPIPAKSDLTQVIRRMGLFQFHRGPDDWGEYVTEDVALGFNRLAILDLAGGRQPMANEGNRFQVIFNGEIYNYKTLRRELEALGHRFRTDHSDTEVIVNGFVQWGKGVFKRLEGMFGIAVWDSVERSLVIARDCQGIKPLYYAEQNGIFVIASEIKAILASGLIDTKKFRESAYAEYFLFRAPVFGTLFESIKSLPAGTWLEFRPEGLGKLQVFWDSATTARNVTIDDIEEALKQAVESHAVADVPLGVFLSGGVDSSYIAALLSEGRDVRAYSVGVPGDLNESEIAAFVAKHLGIEHHVRHVTGRDMLNELNRWCYFNDDPVSDPSALALMLLAENSRRDGMKVMLAGEGADELFGGYNSYLRFAAMNWVSQFGISSLVACFTTGRNRDYLLQGRRPHFLGTGHLADLTMRLDFLHPDLQGNVATVDARLRQWWQETERQFAGRPMRHAMYVDQRFRLPNDCLARTDRATMAWSLETRVPYLDCKVVEAANGLPDSECIGIIPRKTKKLLKELARRRIPFEAIDRPKRGFDLPVGAWLRSDLATLARDMLSDKVVPGLNYAKISEYFEHAGGAANAAAALWAWIVLEMWYRRWASDNLEPMPNLVADHNPASFALLSGRA